MVGVPGKSKGCTTCRRRKIGCDLETPACRRCTQSGRICEGYEHFPVFINRGVKGLQKRKGLEEAKPIHLTRRTSALHSTKNTPSTSSTRALTPVPKTIDSSPIVEEEIIKLFMQHFLPSNVSERSSSSQQWLYQAVAQSQKDTPLHLALGALSLARVGHIQKDQKLITQGQTVYCRALPALQRALYDQRFMWDETILAAGRTLQKYEYWEGSEDSMTGYQSHLAGMTRLVELRGTGRFTTPLERNILRDFRRASLIQCLIKRKSSFLGSSAWRTEPWIDHPKFTEDELYDIGFTMAMLFEEVDAVFNALPNVTRDRVDDITRRFRFIDTELKSWYDRFVAESPFPLYWIVPFQHTQTDVFTQNVHDPFQKKASYCFASLRLASTSMMFWGLQVALYTHNALFASTIARTRRSSPSNDLKPGESTGDDSFISILSQLSNSHTSPEASSSPLVSNEVLLKIGRQILMSTPFCVREDMGLLGPEATLFALRCALWVFNYLDHPKGKNCSYAAKNNDYEATKPYIKAPQSPAIQEELDDATWCREMYKALNKDKGLSMARGLAKSWERGEVPRLFIQGTEDLKNVSQATTPSNDG